MKVVSSQWSVIRKNLFCFVLCAMLFALCFPAAALQSAGKVPRIGFLISDSASDPRNQVLLDALRQGLRDLGYVEGKTINIEYRYAEGRFERLPELVGELVRLKVDILFGTDNRAARAAKKSSTTIPIIITSGGDPVRSGLVASLARPGGNVTGLTTTSSHLIGKRLELLKEVVPKVSRFAFLMPADSAGLRAMYNEAQGTAKALGVTFQLLEVKAPTPDIEGAFRFMVKERIGGLVTESPALIDLHQNKILELAQKHRIPRDIRRSRMGGLRWSHVLWRKPA